MSAVFFYIFLKKDLFSLLREFLVLLLFQFLLIGNLERIYVDLKSMLPAVDPFELIIEIFFLLWAY